MQRSLLEYDRQESGPEQGEVYPLGYSGTEFQRLERQGRFSAT